MHFPRRFPKQPWIFDFKDLIPMGDPETVIFLKGGKDTIVGLRIVGLEGDVMLGIKCDELGRPESCAVTNEIEIDHSNVQSNPRRHVNDEIDPA